MSLALGTVKQIMNTYPWTAVIHIQDREDFQRHVTNFTEKTVLLNFWTDWSDACGAMSTTFSLMSNVLNDQYNLVYADWDKQRWLADQLHVYGVPTLFVLDQGQIKSTILGVIPPDELLSCLTKSLGCCSNRSNAA